MSALPYGADTKAAGRRRSRSLSCLVSGHAKGEPACNVLHSKLMIVDDEWLPEGFGSANFSNRSMGLDTECDLVLAAHTAILADADGNRHGAQRRSPSPSISMCPGPTCRMHSPSPVRSARRSPQAWTQE